MTSVERERISRELCESFGYVYQEGEWLGGFYEDAPVYPPLRDALIDARCRVVEMRRHVQELFGLQIEDYYQQLKKWEAEGATHAEGELVQRDLPRFEWLRLALRETTKK